MAFVNGAVIPTRAKESQSVCRKNVAVNSSHSILPWYEGGLVTDTDCLEVEGFMIPVAPIVATVSETAESTAPSDLHLSWLPGYTQRQAAEAQRKAAAEKALAEAEIRTQIEEVNTSLPLIDFAAINSAVKISGRSKSVVTPKVEPSYKMETLSNYKHKTSMYSDSPLFSRYANHQPQERDFVSYPLPSKKIEKKVEEPKTEVVLDRIHTVAAPKVVSITPVPAKRAPVPTTVLAAVATAAADTVAPTSGSTLSGSKTDAFLVVTESAFASRDGDLPPNDVDNWSSSVDQVLFRQVRRLGRSVLMSVQSAFAQGQGA